MTAIKDSINGVDKVNAPEECFRQNLEVPENLFQIGMKLEATDPRIPTQMCIATVVSCCGPRVLLRLDGTDGSNDFWHMVDSDCIQCMGTAKLKQKMIHPPLGFLMNRPTAWLAFSEKILADESKFAPPECFKTPPQNPGENLFEIGYHLEAVDKKNPDLIYSATITDKKDNVIFISFDGWRGVFDYWCDFDSRDIFPVGWCILANHQLQPPGTKGEPNNKNRRKTSYMYVEKNSNGIMNSKVNNSANKSANSSVVPLNKVNMASQPTMSSKGAVTRMSVTRSSTKASLQNGEESDEVVEFDLKRKKEDEDIKVDRFNIPEKKRFVHIARANSMTASHIFSENEPTYKQAVKRRIRNEKHCRRKQKKVTLFTNIKNNNVNFGKHIDKTKAELFLPQWFGPCSVGRLLKDVLYAFIRIAVNPLEMFYLIIGGNGYLNFHVYHKNLPNVIDMSQLLHYMDNMAGVLGYENLFSSDKVAQSPQDDKQTEDAVDTKGKRPESDCSDRSEIENDDSAEEGAESTMASFNQTENEKYNPTNTFSVINVDDFTTWDANNVVDYIISVYPSLEYIREFMIENEIDGHSFVLMTCDDMIKYMDMKLGPALKVEGCIKKLLNQ